MDPNFLHADSEDSDQTGRMPRLNSVFAGRTYHFVGFVMRWLDYVISLKLSLVFVASFRALFGGLLFFRLVYLV